MWTLVPALLFCRVLETEADSAALLIFLSRLLPAADGFDSQGATAADMSAASLGTEDEFESLFDAARYQAMESKSNSELIEIIRERDDEVENLQDEKTDLRSANYQLQEHVEDLKAKLAAALARGASDIPVRSVSVQQVEDAEADAFADA